MMAPMNNDFNFNLDTDSYFNQLTLPRYAVRKEYPSQSKSNNEYANI